MLWIKLPTNMKQNIFYKMLLIFLIGLSFTCAEPTQMVASEENHLSVTESNEPVTQQINVLDVYDDPNCDPMCGCNRYYTYDSVKRDCVLNLPKLMKKTVVYYGAQNNEAAILAKDDMAKSIYIEGQKLFRGIMISIILFMTCASLCVLSACIYCCKINYSDRKLKLEIEAMAKKLNKTSTLKKPSAKRKVDEPKAQSCNVVVEEAGVFVV